MMNNPLPNAVQGIQLAQTGRKSEALAYLREAVQREPVNAEVWLWLAHITPDRREYQNCVYQALQLEPNHVVARQMQAALMQHTGQQPSASQMAQAYQTSQLNPDVLRKLRQQQRRRWWMRRTLILAITGALLGIVAAVIAIVVLDAGVF